MVKYGITARGFDWKMQETLSSLSAAQKSETQIARYAPMREESEIDETGSVAFSVLSCVVPDQVLEFLWELEEAGESLSRHGCR